MRIEHQISFRPYRPFAHTTQFPKDQDKMDPYANLKLKNNKLQKKDESVALLQTDLILIHILQKSLQENFFEGSTIPSLHTMK